MDVDLQWQIFEVALVTNARKYAQEIIVMLIVIITYM